MANSIDPDQTLHSAVSDLGLHSLPRPLCPNAYGKKGLPITITNVLFNVQVVNACLLQFR